MLCFRALAKDGHADKMYLSLQVHYVTLGFLRPIVKKKKRNCLFCLWSVGLAARPVTGEFQASFLFYTSALLCC